MAFNTNDTMSELIESNNILEAGERQGYQMTLDEFNIYEENARAEALAEAESDYYAALSEAESNYYDGL